MNKRIITTHIINIKNKHPDIKLSLYIYIYTYTHKISILYYISYIYIWNKGPANKHSRLTPYWDAHVSSWNAWGWDPPFFLIPFPTKVPGRQMMHEVSLFLTPVWETQKEFQLPGIGLTHLQAKAPAHISAISQQNFLSVWISVF